MSLCLSIFRPLHSWYRWSETFTVPAGEGSQVWQRRQCGRCMIFQYRKVAP